jgi:hypothetical protein
VFGTTRSSTATIKVSGTARSSRRPMSLVPRRSRHSWRSSTS